MVDAQDVVILSLHKTKKHYGHSLGVGHAIPDALAKQLNPDAWGVQCAAVCPENPDDGCGRCQLPLQIGEDD